MRSPKHLLLFGPENDQQSLLQKLLHHHDQLQREILGYAKVQITLSVRNPAQEFEVQQLCEAYGASFSDVDIVVDEMSDAGPSAGLLAAFSLDSTAHWLVTGCDYPLLETVTLQQLWANHGNDTWTTCFLNDDGFNEPLLAIWSPKALQELQIMAHKQRETGRRIGPSSAIRVFQKGQTDGDQSPKVVCIRPENDLWIKNVNTPTDWQEILPMIGS